MSKSIVKKDVLTDIADAIREFGVVDNDAKITCGEMRNYISKINADGWDDVILSIVTNGTFGTFNKVTLPDGITKIRRRAFNSCKQINSLIIPDSVVTIDEWAFAGCSNLTSITLPSNLDRINMAGFLNCTKLTSVEIPENAKYINQNAFQNCTGLTDVTFKGKPTYIHSSSFTGCTNLTTINVPWSEGQVSNAPWGATSATINYNYK